MFVCVFNFFFVEFCKYERAFVFRCRFSNMLSPIYEEASKSVKKEFPVCFIILFFLLVCSYEIGGLLQEEGRVALAKVDCDKEGSPNTNCNSFFCRLNRFKQLLDSTLNFQETLQRATTFQSIRR